MQGIHFVTDDKNNKIAVQIDLRIHKDLWEDFYDCIIYHERKHEKTIKLDSTILKIKKL